MSGRKILDGLHEAIAYANGGEAMTDWQPMTMIEATETSLDPEVRSSADAILAYLALLSIPHGSVLRASLAGQAALASCRDLVSAACSVDPEIVQDACEAWVRRHHSTTSVAIVDRA